MDPILIISRASEDTFSEMIQLSPRKIREAMYSQFGIKGKTSLLKRLQQNRDDRVFKLRERLVSSVSKQESELCKELIRNWLYTKRPMLKAALDFLHVPNEDGLVDEEPDFFEKLSDSQVKELVSHLKREYKEDHVEIYLRFMGTPHV